MDTIIVSVFAIALIIVSTLTVTVSTLQSANVLADAWRDMETQSIMSIQTEIRALAPARYEGGLIKLSVENKGSTDLYDYPGWDVIIQFQSGSASYLDHTANYPPGPGQWVFRGISMPDGSPELFDPNILNPGEVMDVVINPDTEMEIGETVRIVVSTPNGTTAQCFVTRGETEG